MTIRNNQPKTWDQAAKEGLNPEVWKSFEKVKYRVEIRSETDNEQVVVIRMDDLDGYVHIGINAKISRKKFIALLGGSMSVLGSFFWLIYLNIDEIYAVINAIKNVLET